MSKSVPTPAFNISPIELPSRSFEATQRAVEPRKPDNTAYLKWALIGFSLTVATVAGYRYYQFKKRQKVACFENVETTDIVD